MEHSEGLKQGDRNSGDGSTVVGYLGCNLFVRLRADDSNFNGTSSSIHILWTDGYLNAYWIFELRRSAHT